MALKETVMKNLAVSGIKILPTKKPATEHAIFICSIAHFLISITFPTSLFSYGLTTKDYG